MLKFPDWNTLMISPAAPPTFLFRPQSYELLGLGQMQDFLLPGMMVFTYLNPMWNRYAKGFVPRACPYAGLI